MQDQGDRPVRAGRPSLLSSGEQAGGERQRILSALDGGATPAAAAAPVRGPEAAPRKGRGWAWGAGAAGVLALAAGAVLFANSDDDGHGPAPAHALAAAPAAVVATPAPAPAPTPAAVAAAPAPAVPAAAVLQDLPEARPANPLADLAPAAARPVAKPAPKDQLTRALEKPSKGRAARERKAEQAKLAQKTAKGKAAKAAEPDSDVVLLAALMTHMQPVNRKATPAEQLKVCRQYNAAGEEQCRIRVCEAAGPKEAACRGVAKAPSGT